MNAEPTTFAERLAPYRGRTSPRPESSGRDQAEWDARRANDARIATTLKEMHKPGNPVLDAARWGFLREVADFLITHADEGFTFDAFKDVVKRAACEADSRLGRAETRNPLDPAAPVTLPVEDETVRLVTDESLGSVKLQ